MRVVGAKIVSSFVEPGAPMALACIDGATRKAISRTLAAGASTPQQLRKAFDVAQARALKSIGAQCYEAFLSSEHFVYILELKSKEGIVPSLVDFRLVRVLGQGGFGQESLLPTHCHVSPICQNIAQQSKYQNGHTVGLAPK